MVMGRDSRSEGRGFESRYRILDGHKKHLDIFSLKVPFLKVPKSFKLHYVHFVSTLHLHQNKDSM